MAQSPITEGLLVELAHQSLFAGACWPNTGAAWVQHLNVANIDVGAGGQWDAGKIIDPDWIWDASGEVYDYFYSGINGDSTSGAIGYASSPDGITITKYGSNPIISPESGVSFVHKASVVLKDGTYYLVASEQVTAGVRRIVGYTASAKTGPWTRVGVLLTPGVGDNDFLDCPSLMFDGGVWKMWFSFDTEIGGEPKYIGYAAAATFDGTWTRSGGTLLAPTADASWHTMGIAIRMYRDGAGYVGLVNAFNDSEISSIGSITSSDGITLDWVDAVQLIEPGPSGLWDNPQAYRPARRTGGPMRESVVVYNGGASAGVERVGYADTAGCALQGTAASQPALATFDGFACVEFDGSNDFLVGSLAVDMSEFTMFAVVTRDTKMLQVGKIGGADAGLEWYVRSDNHKIQVDKTGQEAILTGTAVVPDSGWTIVAMRYNGTTLELFFNGEPDGSAAMSDTMTGAGFAVGAKSTGSDAQAGKLRDLLIYSAALGDVDIAEVEAYLEDPSPAPSGSAMSVGGASGFLGAGGFFG